MVIMPMAQPQRRNERDTKTQESVQRVRSPQQANGRDAGQKFEVRQGKPCN
jgi:hypothetical protein